jgi:hypothetical protein
MISRGANTFVLVVALWAGVPATCMAADDAILLYSWEASTF